MNNPLSRPSAIRSFLKSQSSAGIVLMAAAVVALLIANSPLGPDYADLLHVYIGPLSLGHWINDGLMAVFFLLVGLEIKREVMDGQLSTWPRRILPGIAAAGGMMVPALIYLALNRGPTAGGWAIPAATDIAFALGVIALLGNRVPASLRVFLAALAIIDDLGAVLIIAMFYTASISMPDLAGAGVALAVLIGLNRLGVRNLTPYMLVGVVLWVLVLRSGIHATLAGVMLAFTIPLERTPAKSDADSVSPLHRLEHILHTPVGFLVVPIFGLANAAVPVLGLPASALIAPVTLGVAGGLLLGKVVGVFGFAALAIRMGLADMPAHASRLQLLGVALLCGIGFTMSIFITLLAFPNSELLQSEAKIGVLAGSLIAGLLGYGVLRWAKREPASPASPQQSHLADDQDRMTTPPTAMPTSTSTSTPIMLPETARDDMEDTVESFCSLVDAVVPSEVRWNTDGTDEAVNLYHALQYEGEVNNGGHDQYFHNQNGQTPVFVSALAGLRLIGAEDYAELVEAMLSWAEDHPEETQATVDSPRSPTLESLDDRFFQISDERPVSKYAHEWLWQSANLRVVPYDEFWATVFRYQRQ